MARWLTAHAVAELLSVSYDGALRLMKKAGAKKFGALVRIREDVLDAYLQSCPDLEADRESTSDQGIPSGTHTSTVPTGTSASKPRTTSKQKSTSQTSSFESQMKALRRRKAS